MDNIFSDPVLVEAFQSLLTAIVTGIIALLAYFARHLISAGVAYLKAKVGNEQFDALSRYAQVIVRYLEQSEVFENLDGAKKKELAMVAILQYAEKHNLPVDRELLDKIIEASVRIVKKEIPLPGEVISLEGLA